MNPVLPVRLNWAASPKGTAPNGKGFSYGAQMVKISRDGQSVHGTNSLCSTWDDQFNLDDEGGQMLMANAGENGGLALKKDFMSTSPKTFGHTKSDSRVGIVRRIASATRRSRCWVT